MTPLASTTEPEGRGWGGLSAFALGSPGARRPQTGRQPPEAGFGEVLGGRSVTSRRVWRKNPSRPGGLPGPRPTRGGGRAGTRRVGPELASGKAPPLRRTAPPLRGTTQGRPGGRPPRPNQGSRPEGPRLPRPAAPSAPGTAQPVSPRPAPRPAPSGRASARASQDTGSRLGAAAAGARYLGLSGARTWRARGWLPVAPALRPGSPGGEETRLGRPSLGPQAGSS